MNDVNQRILRNPPYEYRLKDRPGIWLMLIAPGCDLTQATRSVLWTFGSDRVIEVRPLKLRP
jgi:hypothetical protein